MSEIAQDAFSSALQILKDEWSNNWSGTAYRQVIWDIIQVFEALNARLEAIEAMADERPSEPN